MVVVIGEVLIDLFQNYERIGGAPFNFAYHLNKLGFPVRFFTRVGEDRYGQRILDLLRQNDFDLSDVQIDPRHPTGTVRVDLDAKGVPHFDICENVAYDHLDLGTCNAPVAGRTTMIYFGSLLQRTDFGHRQVQGFLSGKGHATLGFCDINMRPPHVNAKAVADSLKYADLLKLNEYELANIQRTLNGPSAPDNVIPWLMHRFKINTVALTRGSRGSRLYQTGNEISSPGAPGVSVVDTVGAGDGFAAIMAAGYIGNRSWEVTVEQATRFAAKICGIPGAIPDDEAFYEDFQASIRGTANE